MNINLTNLVNPPNWEWNNSKIAAVIGMSLGAISAVARMALEALKYNAPLFLGNAITQITISSTVFLIAFYYFKKLIDEDIRNRINQAAKTYTQQCVKAIENREDFGLNISEEQLLFNNSDIARSVIKDANHQNNQLVDVNNAVNEKNEKPIKMPSLFVCDLNRFACFKVNGKLAYSSDPKQGMSNPLNAYKKMIELSSIGRTKEEGQKIAERVSRCIVQTLMADILAKLIVVHSSKKFTPFLKQNLEMHEVQINKDQVTIQIKYSFEVKNASDPTISSDKNLMTKRIITIPMQNLADPNLETLEKALPDMQVEELFSPVMTSKVVDKFFATF